MSINNISKVDNETDDANDKDNIRYIPNPKSNYQNGNNQNSRRKEIY